MDAPLRIFIVAAALAALTGAAAADCHDMFGWTNRNLFRFGDLVSGPNCDFLYTIRNAIHAERQDPARDRDR